MNILEKIETVLENPTIEELEAVKKELENRRIEAQFSEQNSRNNLNKYLAECDPETKAELESLINSDEPAPTVLAKLKRLEENAILEYRKIVEEYRQQGGIE